MSLAVCLNISETINLLLLQEPTKTSPRAWNTGLQATMFKLSNAERALAYIGVNIKREEKKTM